jgi:photosystem II stability/assembly factor-like uncharacterized protein
VIGVVVIGVVAWIVPKLPLQATLTSLAVKISSPATTIPMNATMPVVTTSTAQVSIPLAWKRISMGQVFARDTVTGIAVDKNDPDVIYVGMQNAGVYKSIDGGLSWSPQHQGMANTHVGSLTIDPQDPKILYAGTRGGIFKTQDGGENWERIGEGDRLLMDPQNSSHLYAETGGGEKILESTDQGNTWEDHESPCIKLFSWAIDPQDGMTLFGSEVGDSSSCIKGGVYKSSDGGRTWNLIGLEDKSIYSLAVGEDEQGNVLIYAQNSVSKDEGKSWFQQTPMNCDFLPVEADSPDTVYCSASRLDVVILTAGKFSRSLTIRGPSNMYVSAFHADNYQGTQRLIAGGQGLYIQR